MQKETKTLPSGTENRQIVRFQSLLSTEELDAVAREEPLEIFLDGMAYAITMRLPGEDKALAIGFCLTEGIIQKKEDIKDIHSCPHDQHKILLTLSQQRKMTGTGKQRFGSFLSRSSCGVCGRERLSDVYDAPGIKTVTPVNPLRIAAMKEHLESCKIVFSYTGATHMAALFTYSNECLGFAEDVGRHNALDKAIGKALLRAEPDRAYAAVVSSRLSFEMVQKAVAAKVEMLCGVSAPTTLAIDYAKEKNITLIGFLRPGRMNIYSGFERIIQE